MNEELKEFSVVISRGIGIGLILFGIILGSGIILDYVFDDSILWYFGMIIIAYFVLWLGVRLSGERISLLFKTQKAQQNGRNEI